MIYNNFNVSKWSRVCPFLGIVSWLSFLNMGIGALDAGSVAPYSADLGDVGGVVAPYAGIPYAGELSDENTSGTCGVRVNMTGVNVVPWSADFENAGYCVNPQGMDLNNWGAQAGIGTSDMGITPWSADLGGIGGTENPSDIELPNQDHSDISGTKVYGYGEKAVAWTKWFLGFYAKGVLSVCLVIITESICSGRYKNSSKGMNVNVDGTVNSHGVGLPNLRNSCYINSAIQLLFSISKFRAAIFSPGAGDQTDVINDSGKKALQMLQTLFLAMNAKIINSRILEECYTALGYKNNQEDCVEFMAGLLDDIGTVLPESTELFCYGTQVRISPKSRAEVFSRFESIRDEEEIFHPLPIDQSNGEPNTLGNTLEQIYNRSENIEKWELVEKGIEIAAERSQKITKIPEYMLFQICRFSGLGNKLFNRFDFPFEMDLKPYCIDDIGDKTMMGLCGIIVHRGENIYGGHYYAIIRNGRGEWVKFDDNLISGIEGNCIDGINPEANETPYILLYQKLVRRPTQRQARSHQGSAKGYYQKKAKRYL
ncbi:MAG: ubiquitin carboxyl-terminal hydrolase [Puniceicoccales bacterium]|jgi:hypothetical protein|nr:ubiquitin carboxyl-terminal hydrolase [Puniceicoccales bacterium]